MSIDRATKASPVYSQIDHCRVCGSASTETVLSLGDQFIVSFPNECNEMLPRAPIDLARCLSCGLLQLKHSVSDDLMWGREYWYHSSVNQTMRDALKDVVAHGLSFKPNGGKWLDIGANDGFLLSSVPSDFVKIACEPSQPFHAVLQEHADLLIPDFFSSDYDFLRYGERGACDVITSCAMFYDLDDPNTFVADIKKSLAPGGVWINQLSSTKHMLETCAFDNICHEHRCYYDEETIAPLYRKNGLDIVNVEYNEVNGGSMRIYARHEAEVPVPWTPARTSSSLIAGFGERVRKWKQFMEWQIEQAHGCGKTIWAYGASTKGTVLLQYLGLGDRIMAVADRNAKKHGRFMVGSWVPIVGESEMRRANPDLLLVLPWAFREEFIQRERQVRDRGTVMLFPLPNPEFVIGG